MTLHVPLWPMHASSTESRFTLQPEMHRTVNLLSLDINSPEADICHVVDSVPRNLPLGTYRMFSGREYRPCEGFLGEQKGRFAALDFIRGPRLFSLLSSLSLFSGCH